MIIAFSGWRDWIDTKFVQRHIDQEWARHTAFGPLADNMHFRVGDANGADAIVREYLEVTAHMASLTVYTARWAEEGPAAGPIRNRNLLCGHNPDDPMYGQAADVLIAFPEPGRSKPARNSGTWNAIGQAHWRGIEVRVPGYKTAMVSEAGSLLGAFGIVPG